MVLLFRTQIYNTLFEHVLGNR